MNSSFERRAFADQLSIETPEQVALEFPVAGIGSRFVALLLDHLIQFAAFVALVLVIVLISAATGPRFTARLSEKWFGAAAIFGFFLIIWGYYALFEAFWHGQTPGKRAMHLRVIKDSGRQITLFESLARNLLRFVDLMPSAYLTGVVTMLLNKQNKRLGDLAAGTLVVHERAEMQPLLWTGMQHVPMQTFGSPSGQEALAADVVARLSSNDLMLMETFFARALDLPLETRAAMAQRILGEVSARMGVPVPAGNPERALESIATTLRMRGRRT